MPFLAPFVFEIIDVAWFVGVGGGVIGGAVADWCIHHPGPGCVGGNVKGPHGGGPGMKDLKGFDPDVPVVKTDSEVGPCGVPRYNYDLCHDQIKTQSKKVVSSIPSKGVAEFNNVPPACMDLVVVLSGSCDGSGKIRPVPCGSACIQYHGMSTSEMEVLSHGLTYKK